MGLSIACAWEGYRAKMRRDGWRSSCARASNSRRLWCGSTTEDQSICYARLFVLHHVDAVPIRVGLFGEIFFTAEAEDAGGAIVGPAIKHLLERQAGGTPLTPLVGFNAAIENLHEFLSVVAQRLRVQNFVDHHGQEFAFHTDQIELTNQSARASEFAVGGFADDDARAVFFVKSF